MLVPAATGPPVPLTPLSVVDDWATTNCGSLFNCSSTAAVDDCLRNSSSTVTIGLFASKSLRAIHEPVTTIALDDELAAPASGSAASVEAWAEAGPATASAVKPTPPTRDARSHVFRFASPLVVTSSSPQCSYRSRSLNREISRLFCAVCTDHGRTEGWGACCASATEHPSATRRLKEHAWLLPGRRPRGCLAMAGTWHRRGLPSCKRSSWTYMPGRGECPAPAACPHRSQEHYRDRGTIALHPLRPRPKLPDRD